eukprot:206524-Chlamydomonas_euryale.AAC.2
MVPPRPRQYREACAAVRAVRVWGRGVTDRIFQGVCRFKILRVKGLEGEFGKGGRDAVHTFPPPPLCHLHSDYLSPQKEAHLRWQNGLSLALARDAVRTSPPSLRAPPIPLGLPVA